MTNKRENYHDWSNTRSCVKLANQEDYESTYFSIIKSRPWHFSSLFQWLSCHIFLPILFFRRWWHHQQRPSLRFYSWYIHASNDSVANKCPSHELCMKRAAQSSFDMLCCLTHNHTLSFSYAYPAQLTRALQYLQNNYFVYQNYLKVNAPK